jgi:hypothetical protein
MQGLASSSVMEIRSQEGRIPPDERLAMYEAWLQRVSEASRPACEKVIHELKSQLELERSARSA